MAFELEREMAVSARNWLACMGLMIKKEFYTPWGVCDFVGVSFNRSRIRQRLKLGQKRPIGPPVRIELLKLIPDSESRRWVTLEKLEREFRGALTPSELKIELERLVDGGFVISSKAGHLQKLNGWVPLHRRIVALELKLRRVDEALRQATAHLSFATESYVGLPREVAFRVIRGGRDRKFKELGVGIVGIGPSGCKILLRSNLGKRLIPNNSDEILQMHCVERFWREFATSN